MSFPLFIFADGFVPAGYGIKYGLCSGTTLHEEEDGMNYIFLQYAPTIYWWPVGYQMDYLGISDLVITYSFRVIKKVKNYVDLLI